MRTIGAALASFGFATISLAQPHAEGVFPRDRQLVFSLRLDDSVRNLAVEATEPIDPAPLPPLASRFGFRRSDPNLTLYKVSSDGAVLWDADPSFHEESIVIPITDGRALVVGTSLREAENLEARIIRDGETESVCSFRGRRAAQVVVHAKPFRIGLATAAEDLPADRLVICDERGSVVAEYSHFGLIQNLVTGTDSPKLLVQTVLSYSSVDLRSVTVDWSRPGVLRVPPGTELVDAPAQGLLFALDAADSTDELRLIAIDRRTGEIAGSSAFPATVPYGDFASVTALGDTAIEIETSAAARSLEWTSEACGSLSCRSSLATQPLWALTAGDEGTRDLLFWCEKSPLSPTVRIRRTETVGLDASVSESQRQTTSCWPNIDLGQCRPSSTCRQSLVTRGTPGTSQRYQRWLGSRWSKKTGPITGRTTAWPLGGADFWVLHSHETPFFRLLNNVTGELQNTKTSHNGYDLVTEPPGHVQAARTGIIRVIHPDRAGGLVRVNVVNGPDERDSDTYAHISIAPNLAVGQPVQAKQRLGAVRADYFLGSENNFPDHLHWHSGRNPIVGLPVSSRPDSTSPTIKGLTAVAKGHEETPLLGTPPVLRGRVGLTVDAYDEASSAETPSHQRIAPLALGFFITGPAGSEPVGSPQQPVWLFRLDDSWCPAGATCKPDAIATATDRERGFSKFGASEVLTHWRLTNTVHVSGASLHIEKSYWNTRARRGEPATLLGDCVDQADPPDEEPPECLNQAGSPAESRFPDGAYELHVIAEDPAGNVTTKCFDLIVDNWPD